ncbi:MAG: hypothetical protein KKA79_01165, partial [Nanoarchaeota archaeon]|nr:hypothetical protein [Nanoarchaeota archaeon]
MKIPKTFKPDKNLDDKIKYLLDPEVFGNSNASPIRVQNLVIGAAKFLSEKNKISATTLDNYKLSQEIVQDIEYYN